MSKLRTAAASVIAPLGVILMLFIQRIHLCRGCQHHCKRSLDSLGCEFHSCSFWLDRASFRLVCRLYLFIRQFSDFGYRQEKSCCIHCGRNYCHFDQYCICSFQHYGAFVQRMESCPRRRGDLPVQQWLQNLNTLHKNDENTLNRRHFSTNLLKSP